MIRFGVASSTHLGRVFPLLTARQRRELLTDVGTGVASEARNNAMAKGGRRFWAGIARSVSRQPVGADGIEVGASHEAAAHKQFGGRITAPGRGPMAVGAKWLTIPLSPLARDKSVRQLATRYRIFRLGRGPTHDGTVLATMVQVKAGGKWKKEARRAGFLKAMGKTAGGSQRYGVLVPLFVLKKSVKQRADPWFPDERAVFRTVDRVLAAKLGA